jgi:hypothetical protein
MAKQKRKPAVQPTVRGRQLLAMIAEQRTYAEADWDEHPGYERKFQRMGAQITRLGRAILKTRVTSLAAVVDRAILSAWWCQACFGYLFSSDDGHGFHEASVLSVLKLAGLKPWQCNVNLKAA